ncbi:spore gernimation protein, partial [Lysinibacillus sphaericus]
MTENKDFLYKELGHQSDITISSKFYMFNNEKHEVIFVYCHSLVDSVLFLNSLLPNIRFLAEHGHLHDVEIINRYLEVFEIKEYRTKTDEMNSKIFSGFLYFFHVPSNSLYSTNLAKLPERSIEESNMEVSLRGPRDGFVENIDTNFSLIRMRLKSKNLSSNDFTIGDTSKTKVLLLYIENYIDQNTLKNVQSKLNKIKVDNIASSYHIEELLYDKLTLFPLLDYSGRPDFVVSSLNKGRFVILVDGSPSCLIGPVNLLLILKAAEDDQTNFLFVSLSRILRITSLLTSIFLPGLWIALTVHQLNQLPFPLLVS